MTTPYFTLDTLRGAKEVIKLAALSRAMGEEETFLSQVLMGRYPWSEDLCSRVATALAGYGLSLRDDPRPSGVSL